MVHSNKNCLEYHKCLEPGKSNSRYSPSDWSDGEEMHLDLCKQRREQYCLYFTHKILAYLEILTMIITFFSPFLMIILPNIYSFLWFTSIQTTKQPSTPPSSSSTNKVVEKRSKINSNHISRQLNNNNSEVYYEVKIIEICIKLLIFSLCSSHIYLSRFKKMSFCLQNKNNFISYSQLVGYKRYKKSDISKSMPSSFQLYWLQSKIKQSLSFNFFMDSLTVIVTFSFWLVFLSYWNSVNYMTMATTTTTTTTNTESDHKSKSCSDLQYAINPLNPFRRFDSIQQNICDNTKTLYTEQQLIQLKIIALNLSTNFVSTHLFLQLTGTFLINFKAISDWISCKYVVHVVRALDGVSHKYKIGSDNLKSIAVYIIQNTLVDFQPYDPIIVRQKRYSRYSQLTMSDCTRNNISNYKKSHLTPYNDYKEMTILKQKSTNSLKNHTECYPEQTTKSLQNHPLSHESSSKSVLHRSRVATTKQIIMIPNQLKMKSIERKPTKSTETFDFLKMPDIYELNVHAAKRLKNEISYLKYKRKCQLRLLVLISNLFTAVYTKTDATLNTVESSSENQLHKSSEYIFQKLYGPLSKYLRLTKQQNQHNRSMILNRLKTYLQYKMSVESFLSVYFNPPNELFYVQCCNPYSVNTKVGIMIMNI
ncbi:unnamed protein product [Heterobilharzia americana]|nr:unnamed protein product [Heterobilharzia americana]